MQTFEIGTFEIGTGGKDATKKFIHVPAHMYMHVYNLLYSIFELLFLHHEVTDERHIETVEQSYVLSSHFIQ